MGVKREEEQIFSHFRRNISKIYVKMKILEHLKLIVLINLLLLSLVTLGVSKKWGWGWG